MSIRVPQLVESLELGDSVAINGCCVTVVERDETTFTADLVPETLSRTSLGVLAIGAEVNVERAMALGDRFGGHWVQGHVDCLVQVRSRKRVGTEDLLELTVPFEVTRFLVPQGSVTLDGVSLTVVDVAKDRFRVALIPHTRELTTLGKLQPMDVVNLELDVLAKYIDRHLSAYVQRLPRMLREAGAGAGPAPAPLERPADLPVPRQTLARPKEPRSRAVTATAERPKAERPKAPAAASATPAKPARRSSSKARARTASKKASTTKTTKKGAKRPASSKRSGSARPAAKRAASSRKTASRARTTSSRSKTTRSSAKRASAAAKRAKRPTARSAAKRTTRKGAR